MKPMDIYNQVRAANPAVRLATVTIWADGTISMMAENEEGTIANSLEELCAKLAAIVVKTDAEKAAEELAACIAKEAELRAKVAALTQQAEGEAK